MKEFIEKLIEKLEKLNAGGIKMIEDGILYNWMIKNKKVKQYKEATFMNIVRKRSLTKVVARFMKKMVS